MLESASKPKVFPEWMWPAFALALGLTGAVSVALSPSGAEPSRPVAVLTPAAPAPAAAEIVAVSPPPAPQEPALPSAAVEGVPVLANAPAAAPQGEPIVAFVAPPPPPVEEVQITPPVPKITAKFRALSPAVEGRAKPIPPKPKADAPKPVEKAKQRASDKEPGKLAAVPARQEAQPPVAPPPPAKAGAFKLLAVSGETVWVTANDRTTVTAQVGEDLPAGMGKVVAVFQSGARFEKNGEKFDLTVE